MPPEGRPRVGVLAVIRTGLFALLAVAQASAFGAEEPCRPGGEALQAVLSGPGEGFAATFRQTKTLALLEEPLVSSGVVRVSAAQEMVWEVREPEPFRVELSEKGLRAGVPGELQLLTGIAAERLAGLRLVFGAGAGTPLGSNGYRICAGAQPGTFSLWPPERDLLERIDLDVDADLGLPRRALLIERSGDTTEIELAPMPVGEREGG